MSAGTFPSGELMSSKTPGFYGRLAAASMSRPWTTLGLVALVSVIAVMLILRLQMDPDLVRLLPQDDPTTKAIQDIQKADGSTQLVTITMASNDPQKLDTFMTELQAEVNKLPGVGFTLYKVDPELAWRVGLLNIPPEDLARLRDRLRGALALGPAIQNPFVAAQWLDLGAMTSRLKGKDTASAFEAPEGTARLLIRPTGSATDMRFAVPFMDSLNALLAQMQAKPEAQGVTLAWLGGPYHHSVEDLEGITNDLIGTNAASLLLTLLLVVLAFRNFRSVILIFAPILLGNLWALGFAGATVRKLTSFTSFFSAVLVGLGIEFSIHLYSRYREELARSGDLRQAVIRTWDIVGPPSLTSALASAGGFLALWAAHFQGFQQLGTLLAGGNLLCLAAVLVTLPILIQWLDRHQAARQLNPTHTRYHARRLPRRPSFYRFAPLLLALLALFSVAAGLMLPRVQFQFDISELRKEGQAYKDLTEQQQQLAHDSYAPLVVAYPDDATMTADYTRLTDLVRRGLLPEISRVLSIRSILPVDQADRVSILREIAEIARDPNVVYLPPQVRDNLAHIARTPIAPMTREDIPDDLRSLLGASADNHWILMLPSGNMWDLRETARLYDALQKVLPDRPVAGQHLALAVLYRLVANDAPRVAIVALIVVFATTALDLRNVRRALGAIGALIAGMCWSGAGMALFTIKLSMINFVGIPILMGIAVDAIIHLQHRLHEEGPGRVGKALITTGLAVALGAFTNAFSFASLVFASTVGVRSLGYLVVLGLALVTIAAFLFVPLGWMTTWTLTRTEPHAPGHGHPEPEPPENGREL